MATCFVGRLISVGLCVCVIRRLVRALDSVVCVLSFRCLGGLLTRSTACGARLHGQRSVVCFSDAHEIGTCFMALPDSPFILRLR